jgi:hypothetical protein
MRRDTFKNMTQNKDAIEVTEHWPEQFLSQAPRQAAVYQLQYKSE